LEHVVRAKEREVARVREEREAVRAADKERVKVNTPLWCLCGL
jgi:hypothetical protein